MKFLIVFRFLIGALFIFSGWEKLIGAYQNFLYVVQSYEVFPSPVDMIVTRVVPWLELFIGLFLVLGLWLRLSLKGSALLLSGFMAIVAQAMIRQLPITECGCFGGAISFPLYVVFLFDSGLLLVSLLLLKKFDQISFLSLDRYFEKT
jgi:uncharacterized membrane protein YphA (DoxX/SURF4 family)